MLWSGLKAVHEKCNLGRIDVFQYYNPSLSEKLHGKFMPKSLSSPSITFLNLALLVKVLRAH